MQQSVISCKPNRLCEFCQIVLYLLRSEHYHVFHAFEHLVHWARPEEPTVYGSNVLWSQLNPMFFEGVPNKLSISHVLEFSEHWQESFLIAQLFVGQADITLRVSFQPCAPGLCDHTVLFQFYVLVDARYLGYSGHAVLFVVWASALHVNTFFPF